MDPLNVPYVDDAMSPLVDTRQTVSELNRRIQMKAQKAYEKAMKKGQLPLHARLRTPMGSGAMPGYVTVPGYSTFNMTGAGLITGRSAYKYPLKYKLDKQFRSKIKGLYAKQSAVGKALSFKKVYGKIMKKKYGKGVLFRSGGRLFRWPEESESDYANRLIEYKKLLKASYYYTKMLNKKEGKRSKGKKHYQDLLKEVKDQIMVMNPDYRKRKSKSMAGPLEPIAESATVPAASGMYYKGPRRAATGGFIGAMLSAAAPMIMEGVRWIGKKIGQHFMKKKKPEGTGAFADYLGHYPRSTGYTKVKGQPNRYYFWWKVYKLVRKEIPLFFPDRADADTLAQEFVNSHMNMFIADLAARIEKHKQEEQATTGKIAEPLIEAIAKTEGIPTDVAKEIAALPGSETPVGTGILDTIIGMITSPEAKDVLSSAAKAVLPKIVKGVKSFAKGKFMKFLGKHPKLQKVVSAYMPKEETAMTKTYSNEPAIATGVSADSYHQSVLDAPGVYQLARN